MSIVVRSVRGECVTCGPSVKNKDVIITGKTFTDQVLIYHDYRDVSFENCLFFNTRISIKAESASVKTCVFADEKHNDVIVLEIQAMQCTVKDSCFQDVKGIALKIIDSGSVINTKGARANCMATVNGCTFKNVRRHAIVTDCASIIGCTFQQGISAQHTTTCDALENSRNTTTIHVAKKISRGNGRSVQFPCIIVPITSNQTTPTLVLITPDFDRTLQQQIKTRIETSSKTLIPTATNVIKSVYDMSGLWWNGNQIVLDAVIETDAQLMPQPPIVLWFQLLVSYDGQKTINYCKSDVYVSEKCVNASYPLQTVNSDDTIDDVHILYDDDILPCRQDAIFTQNTTSISETDAQVLFRGCDENSVPIIDDCCFVSCFMPAKVFMCTAAPQFKFQAFACLGDYPVDGESQQSSLENTKNIIFHKDDISVSDQLTLFTINDTQYFMYGPYGKRDILTTMDDGATRKDLALSFMSDENNYEYVASPGNIVAQFQPMFLVRGQNVEAQTTRTQTMKAQITIIFSLFKKMSYLLRCAGANVVDVNTGALDPDIVEYIYSLNDKLIFNVDINQEKSTQYLAPLFTSYFCDYVTSAQGLQKSQITFLNYDPAQLENTSALVERRVTQINISTLNSSCEFSFKKQIVFIDGRIQGGLFKMNDCIVFKSKSDISTQQKIILEGDSRFFGDVSQVGNDVSLTQDVSILVVLRLTLKDLFPELPQLVSGNVNVVIEKLHIKRFWYYVINSPRINSVAVDNCSPLYNNAKINDGVNVETSCASVGIFFQYFLDVNDRSQQMTPKITLTCALPCDIVLQEGQFSCEGNAINIQNDILIALRVKKITVNVDDECSVYVVVGGEAQMMSSTGSIIVDVNNITQQLQSKQPLTRKAQLVQNLTSLCLAKDNLPDVDFVNVDKELLAFTPKGIDQEAFDQISSNTIPDAAFGATSNSIITYTDEVFNNIQLLYDADSQPSTLVFVGCAIFVGTNPFIVLEKEKFTSITFVKCVVNRVGKNADIVCQGNLDQLSIQHSKFLNIGQLATTTTKTYINDSLIKFTMHNVIDESYEIKKSVIINPDEVGVSFDENLDVNSGDVLWSAQTHATGGTHLCYAFFDKKTWQWMEEAKWMKNVLQNSNTRLILRSMMPKQKFYVSFTPQAHSNYDIVIGDQENVKRGALMIPLTSFTTQHNYSSTDNVPKTYSNIIFEGNTNITCTQSTFNNCVFTVDDMLRDDRGFINTNQNAADVAIFNNCTFINAVQLTGYNIRLYDCMFRDYQRTILNAANVESYRCSYYDNVSVQSASQIYVSNRTLAFANNVFQLSDIPERITKGSDVLNTEGLVMSTMREYVTIDTSNVMENVGYDPLTLQMMFSGVESENSTLMARREYYSMDFIGLCLKYENNSGAPINVVVRITLGNMVTGYVMNLILNDTSSTLQSTYALACITTLDSNPTATQQKKQQIINFILDNVEDVNDSINTVNTWYNPQGYSDAVKGIDWNNVKIEFMPNENQGLSIGICGVMMNKYNALGNRFINMTFDDGSDNPNVKGMRIATNAECGIWGMGSNISNTRDIVRRTGLQALIRLAQNTQTNINQTQKNILTLDGAAVNQENKRYVIIKKARELRDVTVCGMPKNLNDATRSITVLYDNRKLELLASTLATLQEGVDVIMSDDIRLRAYNTSLIGSSLGKEVFLVGQRAFEDNDQNAIDVLLAQWTQCVIYVIMKPKDAITGQAINYNGISLSFNLQDDAQMPFSDKSYTLIYTKYTFLAYEFDRTLNQSVWRDVTKEIQYERLALQRDHEEQLVISGSYSLIYVHDNLFIMNENNNTKSIAKGIARDMIKLNVPANTAVDENTLQTQILIISDNLFINCESSLVSYAADSLSRLALNYSSLAPQVIQALSQWVVYNTSYDYFIIAARDAYVGRANYGEIKMLENMINNATPTSPFAPTTMQFYLYDSNALAPTTQTRQYKSRIFYRSSQGYQLSQVISAQQNTAINQSIYYHPRNIILDRKDISDDSLFEFKVKGELAIRDRAKDALVSCVYTFNISRDSDSKKENVIISIEEGDMRLEKRASIFFNPQIIKNNQNGGSWNNDYDGKLTIIFTNASIDGDGVVTQEYNVICRDQVINVRAPMNQG